MITFTMLVGLPASGKSLLAKKICKENCIIVSSDAWREKLYGDESIQGDNNKLFELIHQEIIRLLNEGWNVIFDSTAINYKHRMALLQKLNKLNIKKECIIVATPIQDCLLFNSQRERKVPEFVITQNMWKAFTVPAYFEGWDKIDIFYNGNVENYNLDRTLEIMDSFDQENYHHSLTLGQHCRAVAAETASHGKTLMYASLLHDAGKLYTKNFRDSKGNESDIAHYFSHENVSAYESLFLLREYFDDLYELLFCAALINYHMRPYGFAESEKAKEKFKNLVGNALYNDIMILHEADKLAH